MDATQVEQAIRDQAKRQITTVPPPDYDRQYVMGNYDALHELHALAVDDFLDENPGYFDPHNLANNDPDNITQKVWDAVAVARAEQRFGR
jgi:hypothetical protein